MILLSKSYQSARSVHPNTCIRPLSTGPHRFHVAYAASMHAPATHLIGAPWGVAYLLVPRCTNMFLIDFSRYHDILYLIRS